MNRSCSSVTRYLSDYIDGQVSSDINWTIEMHLATCAACAELVRDMRRTVSALSQVSPRPLSAGFDARLAAKLDAVKGARATQPDRSALQIFFDRFAFQLSTSRRDLRLRVGVAAAAMSLVCVGLIVPHALFQAAPGTHGGIVGIHASTSAPTVDGQDQAFIAACANEQSQSNDSQTLVDPAAQTLAAGVDETTSGSPQQPAPASIGQD